MERTIMIAMLGILMLSGVLAYYPGETIEVPNEIGITNLVYTIVNNLTEIPELDISINTENITIKFPGDMPPNSFDIIFLEENTTTIVQTIYRSSGGGSRTKYVDRNVTVEVPKYIDKNITTEVEKIVLNDNEVIVEKERTSWFKLVFAFILGILGVGFYNWVRDNEDY